MKITNFTESAKSGIKVFKPIQYLHICGTSQSGQLLGETKLRVRVVNSESGRVDEIIPLVGIDVLGEICSMNEGFFISRKNEALGNEEFEINVMLHPTSAIYLSNDKYLEIDIQGLKSGAETTIYGIEKPAVDKEFICRYNKFFMASGELQRTFSVGDNENLILPKSSFDEITLHYKNGSSCSYLLAELSAMMMLKNDLVSAPRVSMNHSTWTNESYANYEMWVGYRSMLGLDVADVTDFTIRRSTSSTSFEFILIDTLKE